MSTFDYLSAFYKKQHSANNIIKEIDRLLSTEDINVRMIPFGCENKSVDWFNGLLIKNRSISLLWKYEKVSLFKLDYKYTEAGKEKTSNGRFFVIQDNAFENTFVALTIESSDFYKRALLPLLQSLYPRLLLTFITHKKLRLLLEKFENEDNSTEIIIRRASQRLRFQEAHQGRRVMPLVSWPAMSLEEAFNWVYDHNGWFESLSFDVEKDNRVQASISFTRQGIVRTNSLLERVYDTFIRSVCKTIHNNIELFSHRSRLERSDLSPRPIVIELDEDHFAEVSENQRLIQSMRRLKAASISVLHGNPYVHLSVLDYFDGSAFDIWVLDQQKLVIVPQLRVTVAAIKRLVNHVFDDYAEGKLINYEEVS